MSPKPASPKKKSPAKKKLAVKADYGGVFFGEAPPVSARMQEEAEPEPEDDPLASYRQAAAKAAKAAEKERKEAARTFMRHLLVPQTSAHSHRRLLSHARALESHSLCRGQALPQDFRGHGQ